MKSLWAICLATLVLCTSALADGIGSRARDAVDPDCTVGKAAKRAATKAMVGVGNRCDVGETTRDTLGIDDRDKKKRAGKDQNGKGLLKRSGKN
ncbi:MAG: hypothetical protein AAF637_14160 [Pseudomonadota bacterium]